jgi:nitrous oxidase accessory protein NosD
MSGDYSRHRFNPSDQFSGVWMQQGRVQLDADWNEWRDVTDRRTRAETVDTFGVSLSADISGVAVVSPQTPDAFLIAVSGGSFSIGAGRMYVDGLLAENFGEPDGAHVFDPVLGELHGQTPIAYDHQPFHPDPATPLPASGPHLAYLEVWQREVTHLQRPDLVEKAVGVDTTTRAQTVWQVRLLEGIDADIGCTSPDTDLDTVWDDIIRPSAGRLYSQPSGVSADDDPCELPPSGGYRGLENQLYRIEIHHGGGVGNATFKWSRDNASVAASVVEVVTDSKLKLASLGRDALLRFNTGDWVEIIDDWRELSGKAGNPAQRFGEMRLITVDDATQTISFSPPLPADLIPTGLNENTLALRHLRVIRWDQKGVVRDSNNNILADLNVAGSSGLIPVPGASVWVNLEKGVQVQFDLDPSGGEFRCNDYWNVAARTIDASVEILHDAPPLGIHRHYARLALVNFPDDETDCRNHWPPDCGGGCCTIGVNPGEDIQAAIDSLPIEGGCVCLRSGIHEITASLNITASNIRLEGESPGAVVRAVSPLLYLLGIGSAEQTVVDVEVTGIRFEATQAMESGFLLYLDDCAEVRVANCELSVEGLTYSAYIGIYMHAVRNIVVTDNLLSNMFEGIWVTDCLGRMLIQKNIIVGIRLQLAAFDLSIGEYGIQIDSDFVAQCVIEDNRINHFWMGIRLGEGTRDARICGNRILRISQPYETTVPSNMDELRTYLDGRFYAIDIKSDNCLVQNNHMSLNVSHWGGIRSIAASTRITDNTLIGDAKAAPLTPVPGSIYCYGLADAGNAADHCRIENNRLPGPQTGIVLSRVDHVTVQDNDIDGAGAGWFGVRTADCSHSRICGNRIEEVFFATFHTGGNDNHVYDNQINVCGAGISAASENDLDISGNTVGSCPFTGIVVSVTASAKATANRIDHCGYIGTASLGLAVFAEHIFTESESMVRISDNEVLDTGVDPNSNTGIASAAIGISTICSSCNISHNHTDYTQNVLDQEHSHRALMLIGPLALHYNLASGSIELMVGSAVVTDNRFRGPGPSYLVDFFPVTITEIIDFRFEKVIFNNNICEHLTALPHEDTATVRLWGRNLIAMGNHIKAANPAVNAMSLGNRHRVALMGNITTGDYIRVGTITPAPLTSFNIRT